MYPFDVPKSYGITFELNLLMCYFHPLVENCKNNLLPSGCDLY